MGDHPPGGRDLCAERRYYAPAVLARLRLQFLEGRRTHHVPGARPTFTRRKADGTIGTVSRKGYTRRSTRDDAWRYHLRELAVAEEPLRYMRKYLRLDENIQLDDEFEPAPAIAADGTSAGEPGEIRESSGIAIVRSRLS